MKHLIILYGMGAVWLFTGMPFVPRKQIPSFIGRIPWAVAIGGFLWGYGQFLFNRAGGILSPSGLKIVALMVLLWGIAEMFYERPIWRRERNGLREPLAGTEALAAGILLLAFGTAVMESSAFPLYHVDAVTCFGLKAKALFHSGTFRTAFFYERGIVHVQPDYPLLVPYLESLYFQFCGSIDDILVKHVFLIYAVCLVALVYQSMRAKADRPMSLMLTAVFASVPLFFKDRDTQMVSGGADIVFMVYETVSVVAAVHWMTQGTSGWRRLVVMGSMACLFCKPQGLVFCILLWGLLGLYPGLEWRVWLEGAVPLTAFSLPWLLTARALPREVIFPPLVFSKVVFLRGIAKAPVLLSALAQEPWRIGLWGLFWPTLIVLFLLKKTPVSSSVRFILIFVPLLTVSYLGVYLIYPQPIQWWIDSSLTRWLTHGIPLLMIAGAWSTVDG